MSEKMFQFDPSQYAGQFAERGYVHIKEGVTESFYAKVVKQVEENMKTKLMKEFAIGDKQQAMYEFPEGGDYAEELCQSVGAVCGFDPNQLVVSERHIKAYDATAVAEPLAHKDRFASQISVGLSVHVKEGSTLVLYPDDETDLNPFNASSLMRASLLQEEWPEAKLKKASRVEIKDSARDVIMFRGHSTWHLRANPALTTMLYLKLNAMNCDPLGEDRRTEKFKQQTADAVAGGDEQLLSRIPMVGRRVDYIHKLYNRDWREVIGVVLWNEKHFTIDEQELKLMQAMDGKRTVDDIARAASETMDHATTLSKLRRLGRRGVIDLVNPVT
jgi:hypothetical protein